MINLILDTDIGSDIDDAFALQMLCGSDEVNLLAITTVYRNCEIRSKIAKALLDEWGREIPVYSGCDCPLVQSPESIEPPFVKEQYVEGKYIPPQYDGAAMSKFFADAGMAPLEILRFAEKFAGDLEILSIGALTNIAMAIRLDPGICKKIKRITVMGGCIGQTIPEWNILCDPEAANIVLSSGIPVYMVGLDVCLQCKMPQDKFEGVTKSQQSVSELFAGLIRRWKDYYRYDLPILYDPLAAATLLSDCVQFRKTNIKICLQGELRGVTFESAEGSPVYVAEKVDVETFFEVFWDKFKQIKRRNLL